MKAQILFIALLLAIGCKKEDVQPELKQPVLVISDYGSSLTGKFGFNRPWASDSLVITFTGKQCTVSEYVKGKISNSYVSPVNIEGKTDQFALSIGTNIRLIDCSMDKSNNIQAGCSVPGHVNTISVKLYLIR